MKRYVTYGEERIGFAIRFIPRPSRRVTIHIHPDATVSVDAPETADVGEVMAAVRHRVRWIWSRLRASRERLRHVLPREYVSGESHFYLGRRHVLKVIVTAMEPHGVKLLRGKLEVRTPGGESPRIRALLDAWYRQRAKEVFAKRLAECAKQVPWLKSCPSFRLLAMRTQWGSCSPNGNLVLNPLLVKAPGPCVNYVIFHELCHLKEHNHSARFYALLDGLLPEWRRWKRELDELADHLLNR